MSLTQERGTLSGCLAPRLVGKSMLNIVVVKVFPQVLLVQCHTGTFLHVGGVRLRIVLTDGLVN